MNTQKTYNPLQTPEPAGWLALDEGERLHLVEEYHRNEQTELPNERLHASVHVIIENQIAMGMEPVVRTLGRLIQEGLVRHDAIHAIGCVLAEHIHGILTGGIMKPEDESLYFSRVEKLTAKRWLKGKW